MIVRKKYLLEFEVEFFEQGVEEDGYDTRVVEIESFENDFSEEELMEIARQVGGDYSYTYRIVKEWLEII